jgi:drug/metabolite transporter (DMT)-like permease
MAARRESAGQGLGLGLLARLTFRPLWLLGLAIEALAFLLEVYALSVAPVALVAPVMAADMVVFILLARQMLGERITGGGVAGIVSMMSGIGLLGYAFERDAGVGKPATGEEMFAFGVLGLGFTLGCGLCADRAGRDGKVVPAALGFGLAAGVSYAISVVATRQIGLFVDERRSGGVEVAGLLATPTPYVLVVFSILALGLEQRGLQGRAAIVAFPVTSGISAFLPVGLGLSLFGEPVPEGGRLTALVCSLAMIAGGIIGLGRDRLLGDLGLPDIRGPTGERRPGERRPGER